MENRESPENVDNNMANAPFAVISIHYLLKVPVVAFNAFPEVEFFLLEVNLRTASSV